MSKLKLALKDTAIYGVGMSLQKIIGFLLLPFYTRALSPAEYGVLDSLSTFAFFITVILSMGIDGATGRFFFLGKTEEYQKDILSTSLTIRVVTQIPILLIACFFANPISELLFKTQDYAWAVIITFLIIPCQTLNQLQDLIYRYYRKVWQFTMMTAVRSVVIPLLGILFVVVFKWGVLGARLATLGSTFIMLIFSYFVVSRAVVSFKRYDHQAAKGMLKFGIPLVFAGLMGWVNGVSDRFFLLHYSSLDEIGFYSIASSFSQPIQLLNVALGMSITVLILDFFSKEQDCNKPETKKFQTDMWHIYLLMGVPIAFAISIFSIDLINIATTKEYLLSALAIPWLLLSHILVFSTTLTGNGMTLMVKSKPYAIMLAVAASVNVGLNFIFVPKWGFVGAAMTTVISNFVYFTFAYFWSQKVYYIKRSFIKPVVYILAVMTLGILVPYLQIKSDYSISVWLRIIMIMIISGIPLFIPNYRRLITSQIIKLFLK